MIIIPPPKRKKTGRALQRSKSVATFNDTIIELNMGVNSKRLHEQTKSKRKYVIKRYIELMFSAIINGDQWNLPDKAGSLCVIKETEVKERREVFGKWRDIYCYDAMGNAYSVQMASSMLNDLAYNYKQSPEMKKALTIRLQSNEPVYYPTQLV